MDYVGSHIQQTTKSGRADWRVPVSTPIKSHRLVEPFDRVCTKYDAGDSGFMRWELPNKTGFVIPLALLSVDIRYIVWSLMQNVLLVWIQVRVEWTGMVPHPPGHRQVRQRKHCQEAPVQNQSPYQHVSTVMGNTIFLPTPNYFTTI